MGPLPALPYPMPPDVPHAVASTTHCAAPHCPYHMSSPLQDTWGPQAEWGEHEMDYILFLRAPVTLKPNAEEVDEIR